MSDDLTERLKNGTALNAPLPQAYVPPPELVRIAQGLLQGVMSGQITSLGCIAISPGGQVQCPLAGDLVQLNLGVDLMKAQIIDTIRAPQAGRLLRPHG